MFIRRKSNKNGSWSIQVVDKINGKNILIKSIGSSKSQEELEAMEQEAAEFISSSDARQIMDLKEEKVPQLTSAEHIFGLITDIRQDGIKLILEPVYKGIGFDAIAD